MFIRCGKFIYRKIDIAMFGVWMSTLTFGTQQIFPIFMNLAPKWACDWGEFTQNCTFFNTCAPENISFSGSFQSAVQEFSLLCGEEAYYPTLITSIQFLGVLIGSITFGQISDVFGRKKISLLILVLGMFFSALTGAAPNWQVLGAIRFVVGFCAGGGAAVVFAYTIEIILPNQRLFLRGFFNWGMARFISTLICFIVPNWRYASLALSSVSLPAILLVLFLIPESPKWSESKGRFDEMDKSLAWIGKFNCEPRNMIRTELTKADPSQVGDDEQKNGSVYTLKDLFSTSHMRVQTLTLMIMWFTASLSSYTNDLNSRNLAGNFWVNQFLFSFLIGVSKPLLFILDAFVPQFNRRYVHQVPQFLVVVCYALITILLTFKLSDDGVIVINLIGTFLIEYTWDACYVCAAEGFPTVVRTLGIGTCSVTARIGGIIAPQVTYLANFWSPAPFATVSALGFVCFLVSWKFLPDTKGQELVGSISEAGKRDLSAKPDDRIETEELMT